MLLHLVNSEQQHANKKNMVRLDIKKLVVANSDRVKSVDLHPTEPWALTSLYNGKVIVRNIETQQIIKSLDVSELPVRCAKFVPRKRWIICGADDMHIRVYNYNTGESEKIFEAHSDYIRFIAVHPTQPLVLTCSDDLSIKLWNWEKNWELQRTFDGHTHFVMQLVFSPKDPNVFASCSLDSTIRLWSTNKSTPNLTLDGHSKGVNCIDFYHGADKPYLISGSDDTTVKVWDYQTKACIQTLEGHSHNVTVVCFHPKLPLIISGSEDQIVNIWNATTYKLEETVNYGLERVWALAYSTVDSKIAIGYDGGSVVLKLANEDPVVAMDRKGKILSVINTEVQQLSVKGADMPVDGEKILLSGKEIAQCEIYPEKIEYEPKGRFVSVCGDGEYVIYASVSFKNKTFGSAEEFVWGHESGSYVIREKGGNIKIFKNFKQFKAFKKNFFTPQQIFGGNLIGVRSNEFICFYDWETCSLIRSIGVVPKKVYWNEEGDYLALCCENNFYVLKYDDNMVKDMLKQTGSTGLTSDTLPSEGEGVPNCIEVEEEIADQVHEGVWIGDCFVYTTYSNRLSYYIGGQTTTVGVLDRSYILLGFVEKQNRIYLMDQDRNVISYQLHTSVLQYETAIVRGDLDAAEKLFATVPADAHNQLARFLDNQGLKDMAFKVTKDMDHKFELSIALGNLQAAIDILQSSTTVTEQKWKQLGSIALAQCDYTLAIECMKSGKDFGGLLLLYSSTGDRKGVEELAAETRKQGKNNIAFSCYFLLGATDKCIDLLIDTGRVPEAAFFARSYAPSQVSRVVQLWKTDLKKTSEKVADTLADPAEYANVFTNWEVALKVEKQDKILVPASQYPQFKDATLKDLVAAYFKENQAAQEQQE